ncbi:transcription factor E2F5-like isoform X2 [Cololabis saira]|uniref:transcription factor E2F5-like isoform X2 n=1 Tax=Cololabis saira TaxID=129043 RepID=UPI002AD28390|nr:transcription factor E2F5-like isoform X2 [Cololabis saira]
MKHESSPQSPDEDVQPDQPTKYPRSSRSLNRLATRFIGLLQEAEGGQLDLRYAYEVLSFGQKRRIYDITNVLEGIGLIRKISKCIVKWMGANPQDNIQKERILKLRSEVEALENMEHVLDQQTLFVEQDIKKTTEECRNLNHVTHEDIFNCFNGHTVLTVQSPPGTQVDVPIPKAVPNCPPKYQIHLKSVRGPIDVVFLNKCSVSSVPVVLPVPPPKEILQRARLAMLTSEEKENSSRPSQDSASSKHGGKSKMMAVEDMQPLHASSLINTEPNRTDDAEFRDLSKELLDPTDPLKGMNADLVTRLMATEAFSQLACLSTVLSEHENVSKMDDSESL